MCPGGILNFREALLRREEPEGVLSIGLPIQLIIGGKGDEWWSQSPSSLTT